MDSPAPCAIFVESSEVNKYSHFIVIYPLAPPFFTGRYIRGWGPAARIRAHCGGPLISSFEQYSLFVRFYICLSCTDYESLLLS